MRFSYSTKRHCSNNTGLWSETALTGVRVRSSVCPCLGMGPDTCCTRLKRFKKSFSSGDGVAVSQKAQPVTA